MLSIFFSFTLSLVGSVFNQVPRNDATLSVRGIVGCCLGQNRDFGEKSDENLCLNRWHQSRYCFPIVKLIVGFRQLESTIQFVDIVTGVTKIATLT